MTRLLAAALRYAELGWPVFPCKPRGKAPAWPSVHRDRAHCRGQCGRFGHGFYDATTNPDLITRMWQPYPLANVAVATGAPGPDVSDVDTERRTGGRGVVRPGPPRRVAPRRLRTRGRGALRNRVGGLRDIAVGEDAGWLV